eukprot:CAMPEP_0119270224 /NCGR_PEP_ID=MMETSP1329-20130426/7307_1 /TAXON_ID=114041 /ORGANISM="Genus nov. species nov., Strain RCC1024" /LENGTH=279 /DNA_ID=CAMNT_0007270235 /DNA_START=53 /DNA_END=890 /DNA_ORIENTATION=-
MIIRRPLEVLEDAEAVDELLRHEARDGEHGHAAVLQLLGRDVRELGRVRGLEARGVEADVAGVVRVLEAAEGRVLGQVAEGREVRRGLGRHPAVERAVDLGAADEQHEDLEEGRRLGAHLGEVVDGGADGLAAEVEERVEARLLDEEADDGEHRDAAVRDLGLAQHLDLRHVLAVEEAEGVEVARGRQRAGQAEAELALVGRPAVDGGVLGRLGRLLLDGGRAEGGLGGDGRALEGRGGAEGEGDDELLIFIVGVLERVLAGGTDVVAVVDAEAHRRPR